MIPTTYLEYLVRLLRYNEALERLLLNLHSSVTPGGVRYGHCLSIEALRSLYIYVLFEAIFVWTRAV